MDTFKNADGSLNLVALAVTGLAVGAVIYGAKKLLWDDSPEVSEGEVREKIDGLTSKAISAEVRAATFEADAGASKAEARLAKAEASLKLAEAESRQRSLDLMQNQIEKDSKRNDARKAQLEALAAKLGIPI
jgi:hypothetical protein